MLPLSVSSTSDFTSELNWTELIRACKCYLCRWALLPILQLNWTELNRVCKCYRFCCVGTTVGFVSDRTITVFLNWRRNLESPNLQLNWTKQGLQIRTVLTELNCVGTTDWLYGCKWQENHRCSCCAGTTVGFVNGTSPYEKLCPNAMVGVLALAHH